MAATARTKNGGVPAPRTAAELEQMAPAEILAYVKAGGSLADVIRHATHFDGTVTVHEPENEPRMAAKTYRLPVDMVAELAELAGHEHTSPSALVREAVSKLLAERSAA